MADIISGKSRFSGDGGNVIRLGGQEKAAPDANQEQDDDDSTYRKKIAAHKRRMIGLGVSAVVLVVVIVMVISYMIDSISYADYSVNITVSRDDSETTKYTEYKDGYLRYSNDGIAYHNSKGNSVWDKTFSMQKPQVKVCGDTVAVGDINGSSIYVFNASGMLGSIDTSLNITQIEVTKQGLVAAVLEDNEANYINLYDTSGDKIYSVKTSLSGDGYPLDISVSEDGTKLVASFLYVSGESMKTNVVFYNFSEVGQNETERIVGGFNHYGDTIVGDVFFMDDKTAVAVGENVISIYKIKEYPKLYKEITVDNEIERVVFSDEYIGIVEKNEESGDMYKMVVYNATGGKECQISFSTQYDNIELDGRTIVMSNDSLFTIVNFKGKELAKIQTELPITSLLTLGKRGSYILVNSKYVQFIKLK
jgi:hypothetical protein